MARLAHRSVHFRRWLPRAVEDRNRVDKRQEVQAVGTTH